MHKNLLFINDNNKLVGFIITEIRPAVHYNRNYCHRRLFEKMIIIKSEYIRSVESYEAH